MNRHLKTLLLFCSTAAAAFAQNAGSATPATKPAMTLGGDFRARYERYENVQTLSSSAAFNVRDYWRVRLRVWDEYTPAKEFTLFGRVSAEPRYWYNAASTAAEGEEWKYGIVDNLYAKLNTQVAAIPLTVVAGRQDIQLGDQWLVSDGTPGDGSWTNYFDGARATFDLKAQKTKLDVIAFRQRARPGDHFPILGREGAYTVMEQDETGVILYASNKSLKDVVADAYFIYKGDDKVVSAGNNGDLYTIGTRFAATPTAHWLYSAEAAYQWGERDLRVPPAAATMRDVSAFGFNSKLTYSFKDTLSNQLTVLAEYLSGDDDGTKNKDEMFDNLWGRYPRLGETWGAAYALESNGRSSQFQNLFRIGATWTVAPTKTSSIATTYCAMFAPQSDPTRPTNAARFSGDGHFRGHMLQVVGKQKFNKWLSGLIFAEASFMGDYYANHDTMTFLRVELLTTF